MPGVPPRPKPKGNSPMIGQDPSQSDTEARLAVLGEAGRSQNGTNASGRESWSLYQSLVEHLPVCVFRKDADGRFVYANSRFCRLKGVTDGQLVGKEVPDVPGQRMMAEQAQSDHESIMRTGASIEREEEYPQPDGTIKYYQAMKSPVFNAEGKIVGSQGILLDITQRKQAEAELACERELLRSLLDGSPDHIYFKDLQSRFLRASNELCDRFGVTAQDVIGTTDFDFFDEDHARSALEDEQEIIRTGKPVIGKVERETLKGRDGENWVLTTKMPLRNRTGQIIGTFGISKDITVTKHAEMRLEQAHKQLVEASRMAGMAEVATSVLHNVGNVLNSVNISSSIISEKIRNLKVSSLRKIAALVEEHAGDLSGFFSNDSKGRELPAFLEELAAHTEREQREILSELSLLAANIEHIKEIVAMQQSYAKISGMIELLPAAELVEDALRMNAGAMERHKVHVVRDYTPAPPVLVDKHKALQILVNLIRNAKYALAEANRKDKMVTLQIRPTEHHTVRISVSDNGVGIGAENLTRIFEHGFTTRKDGHGFGLHSGALVARELGGSLTVRSEGAGKGALFALELPTEPERPKTGP
jgi:PAS domain S-box-containing protein